MGNNCFVTQHNGATYLWCDAPYIVICGGRASLLQGAKRDRDVLGIDFNSFRDRLTGYEGTADTVTYKRIDENQHKAGDTSARDMPEREEKE